MPDFIYIALTYVPLIIIGMGVITNTISFIIFRFTVQFKNMPSMIYLSCITITDTLALFVWNLDHFLSYHYSIGVETYICQIATFDQYFSLQSSALLLSMLTVDRYITVVSLPGSFFSKLPFGTRKSALFWSLGIIALIAVINSHLLFFPRYYAPIVFGNGTQNSTIFQMSCYIYNNGFNVFPIWENVHLVIFNLIPFIIMTTFNGLLIKDALMSSNTSRVNSDTNKKLTRKKHILTIYLIMVTLLFLVMTLPSSIIFGFFYGYFIKFNFGASFLLFIDCLSFINNTSIFFISLATNSKFRRVIGTSMMKIFCCSDDKCQKPITHRLNLPNSNFPVQKVTL